MTPFPETEIMTIKRIEVALRKLDFKLLKDGAYKLHEKFHSGHKFEYLDLVKDLYLNISSNTTIPPEVKNLLLPTIEDILKAQNQTIPTNQSQPSIQAQSPIQQPIQQPVSQVVSQPVSQTIGQQTLNMETIEQPKEQEFDLMASSSLVKEKEEVSTPKPIETPVTPPISPVQTVTPTINQTMDRKNATISVFYGAETTKEQEERIYQYKKLISNEANVNELANLTSDILASEKIDITDLSLILNILKQKTNPVNLLTNSKSEKIVRVLEDSQLDWNLFDFARDKKRIKFYPLLGLNGLFKCKKCKREHFEIWDETMPISLLCPNCKSPMFIDFAYSNDLDLSINMEYYNASVYALTESKIWLLVNPPMFDKIIIDMLKSALKISKVVEEIYIVSPKTEISDKYKSVFYSTGKNVRIDITSGTLNNFWQSLG